jgi:hypothetical protein
MGTAQVSMGTSDRVSHKTRLVKILTGVPYTGHRRGAVGPLVQLSCRRGTRRVGSWTQLRHWHPAESGALSAPKHGPATC